MAKKNEKTAAAAAATSQMDTLIAGATAANDATNKVDAETAAAVTMLKESARYGETMETVSETPGARMDIFTAADGIRADLLGSNGAAVVFSYRAATVTKGAKESADDTLLNMAAQKIAETLPARNVRKSFADTAKLSAMLKVLQTLKPERTILTIPPRAAADQQ